MTLEAQIALGFAHAQEGMVRASFGSYEPPEHLSGPRFHLTDAGNSLRFTHDHYGRLIYVHGPGWHIWDGRRWRKDESAAWRAAKETALRIRHEAAAIQDEKSRDLTWVWARQSESKSRMEAMLKLAEKGENAEKTLLLPISELEKRPHLLNCANGTVNLKTGKCTPHRKEHYLTHLIDIEYDPKVRSAAWERFVDEIFLSDGHLAQYAQCMAGYCATGENREKCFVILNGAGDNGKTVYRETLTMVLGEFARTAQAGTFVTSHKKRNTAEYDLARLLGARIVTVPETERGDRLAVQTLKEISGRDTVAAREPYGKPFDYKPTFKIWITTNTLPSLAFNEKATWARIRVIPFNRQFSDREQDKNLTDKLAREAQGILTWIAEGARTWYRQGLGELPLAVVEATFDYRVSQDTVSRFLEDETEDAEHVLTQHKELLAAYREYCRSEGLEPMGRNDFYAALRNQGYGEGKNAESSRCFRGLRLR
jgi:putative DNA primase/helicase